MGRKWLDIGSAYVVSAGAQKVVGRIEEWQVSGSRQEGRADRRLPVDASQRIKRIKKCLVSIQGAL